MPTINNSTNINAPVEKVFAYVTDPTNAGSQTAKEVPPAFARSPSHRMKAGQS